MIDSAGSGGNGVAVRRVGVPFDLRQRSTIPETANPANIKTHSSGSGAPETLTCGGVKVCKSSKSACGIGVAGVNGQFIGVICAVMVAAAAGFGAGKVSGDMVGAMAPVVNGAQGSGFIRSAEVSGDRRLAIRCRLCAV